MLFSTARGSRTSHCLNDWSRTSRRENGAAGKAQTFLFPNNPLPPRRSPSRAPVCSTPALAFPPEGLSGGSGRSWEPKRGPVLPRHSARRLQGPANTGCLGGLRVVNEAIPSARSRSDRAGAARRWPFWPPGGGAGKLTSVKVGFGPRISPFSVRSPPAAANGVGRAGTLAPAGGKLPLAGANEPA